MVYVTHDQTEALTFADKVVVMYEGEVVQIGTPEELFERPAHTFVGYFIGSPGMNVVAGRGATAPAPSSPAPMQFDACRRPIPISRPAPRPNSASGRNSCISAATGRGFR